MAQSEKYGRTWHYPFSPGTTSDDRINHEYWQDIQQIEQLVHTEKLDGENNCLNKFGVFARSHAAPTLSPWTQTLRQYWQQVKNDLHELEIFVENLYAIHSIEYTKLEHHFFVFAIREGDTWLSWEETLFYAAMVDLPVVPEIAVISKPADRADFEKNVLRIVADEGAFGPKDTATQQATTMEGIVTRNAASYTKEEFKQNVFKYVRKGHVKTNEHWTRNWKRAPLKQKGGKHVEA
jgi:hypothetical protein